MLSQLKPHQNLLLSMVLVYRVIISNGLPLEPRKLYNWQIEGTLAYFYLNLRMWNQIIYETRLPFSKIAALF